MAQHAKIIPVEHVTKLLHELDTDFDDYFTPGDLLAFVRGRKYPTFPDELLESMFAEANNTGDGMIDAEQLGKAVGGQHPHRQHNEDWYRLFELALGTSQLTQLPPSPLPPERVHDNFERYGELVTFSPQTSRPRMERTRSIASPDDSLHASRLTKLSTMSSVSSALEGAPAGAQPPARQPAAADLDASVNHHLKPGGEEEGGPLRCGFAAKRAYIDGVQLAADSSHGFGWRGRLMTAPTPAPTAEELHYGLHEHDWRFGSMNPQAAYIPTRVDGQVTRVGSGLQPLRLLNTENSTNKDHQSRTNRLRMGLYSASGKQPVQLNFPDAFARGHTRALKDLAAKQRIEIEAKALKVPSHVMDFAFGRPRKEEFRAADDPTKRVSSAPYVIGALGCHWPRKEGRPPDTLYDENMRSLRLALTENEHPSSRFGAGRGV